MSAEIESTPTPLRGRESQATKDRLLDAAETLFAERGFRGTSMRAVTQAAGVSLSAANYHFGSKQALLESTLYRVIEPVNRGRLAKLDALERAAAGAPLPLRSILDAFLRPAIEGRATVESGPARFRQVAAVLFSEPPEFAAALRNKYFGESIERFNAALVAALPDRDPNDLAIAFQFTVGVMVHVISGQLEAVGPTDAVRFPTAVEPLDDEETLARMVAYAEAGLRAASIASEDPR